MALNQPSVVDAPNFNAAEKAARLHAAIKGFGTNQQAIVDVLTTCSNTQRQEIAEAYSDQYGKILMDELTSEFCIFIDIDFKCVLKALMCPPVEYLCKELNKFIRISPDTETVTEILCPMNNTEIAILVKAYEQKYERALVEHMCMEYSKKSKALRNLLTHIITGTRNERPGVVPEQAQQQAQELYDATEKSCWNIDEEVFIKIFGHESYAQLRQIFVEYRRLSGRTIEKAIKVNFRGSLKQALITIVECAQDRVTWFATCLRDAIVGTGTDDYTLVRIIVSRSEIDLGAIQTKYEYLYNTTLEDGIRVMALMAADNHTTCVSDKLCAAGVRS